MASTTDYLSVRLSQDTADMLARLARAHEGNLSMTIRELIRDADRREAFERYASDQAMRAARNNDEEDTA